MSKPKRNDPCPCGSGAKFKKCCGKNNVIEFNPSAYNNELESLMGGLIDFAITHFESELIALTQNYTQKHLGEYEQDELDIYIGLISAWIILTKPIENDQTIFDMYYLQQKNKIKYARTRRIFQTWGNSQASVFEILSIDHNANSQMTIQDVYTHKTYEFQFEEATEDVIGNLLIGFPLPFVQKSDFFFSVLEVPKDKKDFVYDLLDEFDVNNEALNDVFPEFSAKIVNPVTDDILEWTDPRHELVGQLFAIHMLEKGFEHMIVDVGVLCWHIYCLRIDPHVNNPASYAAALEYYIQHTTLEDASVTQKQIAEEYGISAGTVSTNYRRLLYELEDLGIPHLLEESYEETQVEPSLPEARPESFNMEKKMRTLEKLLGEQEFNSPEEVSEFLNDILGDGELPTAPETPRDQAQDLIYEAEFEEGEEQKQLIDQALDLYPHNPDAYVLLADRESTPHKRHEILKKAVKVGEKDLGKDFFEENKGYFWGIIETRPYMRAKASYAMSLYHMGSTREAIEEFEELLELNPNDNQGIRDHLLPLYIELELFEKAEELLELYKDDVTATIMFSKALVSFRVEGMNPRAYELFKDANEKNPYVLDYLLKRKRIPNRTFDYITLGEESEAIAYVQENIHLWEDAEVLLREFE